MKQKFYFNYVVDGVSLFYTFNNDGETLCVSKDEDALPKGKLVIPEKAVLNGEDYEVTKISKCGFWGCDELTEVVMSDTITEIDDAAFYACSKLSSVHLSTNLKTIGISAFRHCSSLEDIVLPKSVTSLGDSAFHDCKKMKTVVISSALTSTQENCFGGSVEIIKKQPRTDKIALIMNKGVFAIGEQLYLYASVTEDDMLECFTLDNFMNLTKKFIPMNDESIIFSPAENTKIVEFLNFVLPQVFKMVNISSYFGKEGN